MMVARDLGNASMPGHDHVPGFEVPRSRPYDVFVMGSSLWTSFSPNANPGPGPPRPVVAVLPIAFQMAVGDTPSGPRIRSPEPRLSTMTGGPSGRRSGAVSASLR